MATENIPDFLGDVNFDDIPEDLTLGPGTHTEAKVEDCYLDWQEEKDTLNLVWIFSAPMVVKGNDVVGRIFDYQIVYREGKDDETEKTKTGETRKMLFLRMIRSRFQRAFGIDLEDYGVGVQQAIGMAASQVKGRNCVLGVAEEEYEGEMRARVRRVAQA